jgi:hypothetical protein
MRSVSLCCLAAASLLLTAPVTAADQISGDYLETRTCDVYTGPCFANAQVGTTGHDAILAWSIDQGSFQGVDLAGLKVVMAVHAADTLGFGGGLVIHPDPIKSVVLVDRNANQTQRAALVAFAKNRAGRVAGEVVRVEPVAIEMSLDHLAMVGRLRAGDVVEIETRKLGSGDCVCTNEQVFYPPLTDVDGYEPAYTVKAGFQGRGLASRWQAPGTRSSFLAAFHVADDQLAGN